MLRYWSNAWESLFQSIERPVQAAEMSFFIDLTVVSTFPLSVGNEDVVKTFCVKCPKFGGTLPEDVT